MSISDEDPVEYDPWLAGWLLGKYQQRQRWPDRHELDEWIEGFQIGCTEVAEHHIWRKRLKEYLEEDEPIIRPLYLLAKCQ